MKVSRQYLNRYVEVIWRDPCAANVKSYQRDLGDVPRGRGVLARQIERGVITDITDGIVRIEHNRGEDSPMVPAPSTDLSCTWVDEALIESITVYEPKVETNGNGGGE